MKINEQRPLSACLASADKISEKRKNSPQAGGLWADAPPSIIDIGLDKRSMKRQRIKKSMRGGGGVKKRDHLMLAPLLKGSQCFLPGEKPFDSIKASK